MEESTFAQFIPITDIRDENREQLRRYYLDNNLAPDNDMLKKYLNWPTTEATPVSANGSKKSVTPQVDIGQVLANISFAPKTVATATQPTTINSNVSAATPVTTGPVPKNKKEFLAKYGESAERAAKESGISKELLLAQIALETGWGKHTPGNNIGGIKANKSWKGKKQALTTTEHEKGKNVRRPESFRIYDTPEEGFKGYVDFLMSNKRYHVLKGISDPYQAAAVMGTTGYATDPNYTTNLQNVIKQIQST